MPKSRKRKVPVKESPEADPPAETGPSRSKYFKSNTAKAGTSCKDDSLTDTDKVATDDVTVKSTAITEQPNDSSLDSGRITKHSFFKRSCEDLAKALLGTTLSRKLDDGTTVAGIIVETEAYLGGEDKAAHSYNGKKTNKNAAMYMDPGTIYVYHIYGAYTCINISSQGEGAAVLIRGLDATDGLEKMRKLRGTKRADKGKGLKDKDLGGGPSKLTMALSIDKDTFNTEDITTHDKISLETGIDVAEADIVCSSRVGVDYADEWAKKPLRFYVRGNKSVSVRDKAAEEKSD